MSAVLGLFAGLLQLIVPSYALRLVRLFGSRRVGWFIVAAFSMLALLHLLVPGPEFVGGSRPDFTLNLVYAIGAVLLLIGMGHLETICSARDESSRHEERLRADLEMEAQHRAADLQETNRQLLLEVARRDEVEKALAASDEHYRYLFFENPQPIWIFDRRTLQLLTANTAALRQYGFHLDEFLALSAHELISASALAQFQQDVLRPCAEAERRGVWEHRRQDGTVFEADVIAVDLMYGDVPARLIVACELTERQREERRARLADRVEVTDQVAGGTARFFQGIFGSIEAQAGQIMPRIADPKCADQIKQISMAATRGTALTRQLLATSARHPMKVVVLDLNATLRDLNHAVGRILGEGIQVQHAYGAELTPILADPRLVEHIILNLVANARDAMSAGGTLTISTRTFHCQNPDHSPWVKPGLFACLAFRDTGCGMSPEVQARIFQPFFTTRDSNRFAGLGLASTQGLVRQHGGWIEFTSGLASGTEFRVYLPCAPATAVLAHNETSVVRPLDRGTIMLVEPDERARGLAHFVLNRHGYRVVEADSGSIALLLWQSQSSKINLLLTSPDLPGELSGTALAAQLLEAKPALKVMLTGAASPAAEDESARPAAGFRTIPKPYTPEKLIEQVEQSLADESS